MPAGSTPRSNGAANHNAGSSNGGRVSRTMFGLSANTPQQAPVAERQTPVPVPGKALPAVEAREEAKAREASLEHARSAERSPPPVAEREPLAAIAAAPPSSPAPTNGATVEAPEPEDEFFEAGDEGPYAGGPKSGIPQPLLGHDHDEPPVPRRRHSTPSGHARTRRGTRVVAFVLVAAAVPLVVALWQKLAARTDDDDSGEASSAVTAEPTGASAVQHDGNTGAGVAPTGTDVSSAPVTEARAAEAALVADASAPADAAPALPPPVAAAEAPAAAAEPSPPSPAPAPAAAPPLASEPARPAVAAKPRPRAARTVSAVAPSPPAAPPEAPPATAPDKSPAPSPELRPGEKPPTAAYPLH